MDAQRVHSVCTDHVGTVHRLLQHHHAKNTLLTIKKLDRGFVPNCKKSWFIATGKRCQRFDKFFSLVIAMALLPMEELNSCELALFDDQVRRGV